MYLHPFSTSEFNLKVLASCAGRENAAYISEVYECMHGSWSHFPQISSTWMEKECVAFSKMDTFYDYCWSVDWTSFESNLVHLHISITMYCGDGHGQENNPLPPRYCRQFASIFLEKPSCLRWSFRHAHFPGGLVSPA